MAEHTRWIVSEDIRPGMGWNRHIIETATGHTVCFMAHSEGKDNEGDASKAHLIAAAPDLLEFAKKFATWADTLPNICDNDELAALADLAEAVIKQAGCE